MKARTYHIITAIGGTLVLAVVAFLALTWSLHATAKAAYDAGDYAQAEEKYETVRSMTIFDRWRPEFGVGTSRLAAGDAEGALAPLERALELVPAAEQIGGVKDTASYECLVRQNLYLTHAQLGDPEAAIEVLDTCINPDPSATGGGDEEGDGGDGGDKGGDGGGGSDGQNGQGGNTRGGENDGRSEREKELDGRNRQGQEEGSREAIRDGERTDWDDQGW